jgi:TetR/AcrR family transcriptional repressor of nem operon
MVNPEGTKVRALREAQNLLQSFGFNGFSFQHIADLIGIKKPSLYDHFKSKEELGQELVKDYLKCFTQWTETIEVFEPKDQIGAYFEIFYKFSSNAGKLCPLSAMIADYHSLPKSIHKLLTKMFLFQNTWLQKVIEEGQKKKVFRKDQTSKELADLIQSIGFGAQLIARMTEDPNSIKNRKEQALQLLTEK